MPRPPRLDFPGMIYHIYNRGAKKLPLFHEDSDRQQFLRFLLMAKYEFPFKLHAYCLMTNHYHLLLQTVECSVSKTMHYFATLFANWFNRKYPSGGHVFYGRFQSIPVQEDPYFKVVARYIHLNPVRARIVAHPEDYPWSDYRHTVRAEPNPLSDPRELLGYFGADPALQRKNYRIFVEQMLTKPEPITERILSRMRAWGEPMPAASADHALAQKSL